MTTATKATPNTTPSILKLALTEKEYRYLFAMICEHDPHSQTGVDLIARMFSLMGTEIDRLNGMWYDHYISISSRDNR